MSAWELNIEPLKEVPGWYVRFLKAFKRQSRLPVRLAVPPVSSHPMPGYHWSEAEMARIVEVVARHWLHDMGLNWEWIPKPPSRLSLSFPHAAEVFRKRRSACRRITTKQRYTR
ncbi:MAG: hypothetical protein R3B54_02710 [Bdellovibrionota bacterium]